MLRSSIQVVITDGIIFVMGSKRKYQKNVKIFNGNGILYFHSAWVKTNTEGKHMLYKINFLVNGISHANLVEASNIELAKVSLLRNTWMEMRQGLWKSKKITNHTNLVSRVGKSRMIGKSRSYGSAGTK